LLGRKKNGNFRNLIEFNAKHFNHHNLAWHFLPDIGVVILANHDVNV
jgi:hypothetical protein